MATHASVDARHPQYTEFDADWRMMSDTYRGERVVKERRLAYLPATSGMHLDGLGAANTAGTREYEAYLARAHFPSVVNDAVQAAIGVMHHKPPVIDLPAALEPLRMRATLRNESLDLLVRRINEQQLVLGRLGLMLDLPAVETAEALPYLAMYPGDRITNWDEGRRGLDVEFENLRLIVLDESEDERQSDFSWYWRQKYRVLMLGDQIDYSADLTDESPPAVGPYTVAMYRQEADSQRLETTVTPAIRGQTLDRIPFVFINSKDVVAEPDDPPLIGLAQLALTIYRGEADYRQALFAQGQDTLVVIGVTDDEQFRVGANASIILPMGGDAKFIGVESEGLVEMRAALENDRSAATQQGGQLLDSVSRQRESGEALRVRVAARTATLNQIALAGAYGLEQILKIAAEWVGANPEEVKVEPNLDFVDDTIGGKEVVEIMTAKTLGAPLSLESVHRLMQDKGLTEMSFEDELALIGDEDPLMGGSTNPDGPEGDDDLEDDDEDPDEDEA